MTTFAVNPRTIFASDLSWEEEVAMEREARMIENAREEGYDTY